MKTLLQTVIFASLLLISVSGVAQTSWLVQFANAEASASYLSESQNREASNQFVIKEIYRKRHISRLDFNEDMTQEEIDRVIGDLRKDRSISYIAENQDVVLRSTVPNDPSFLEQWGMERIMAPNAWDITQGGVTVTGDTIVVAILDSGFDVTHPDLMPNFWVNQDEVPNDNTDNDNNGYIDDYLGVNMETGRDDHPAAAHGTSVSGIIGARGNNDRGVTGVNWNVKLMMISGISKESDIISGYQYIIDSRELYNSSNGAEGAFVVVTNLSAGIDKGKAEDHPLWCGMYNDLGQVGVLSATATTNKNLNVDEEGDIPSTCTSEFLLSVTNTNQQDEKVQNAGYGVQHVDLAAPGSTTTTSDLGGGIHGFPGTSAATPHVAGVVALIYAAACPSFMESVRTQPEAMASNVRSMVLNSTDKLASLDGLTSTGGRLNAYESLLALTELCGGTSGELGIVNIFPNPSNGEITIEFEAPDNDSYDLLILNSIGQLLHERQINAPLFGEKKVRIPTLHLTPGVYFVSIRRGKDVKSERFMISE